MSFVDRDSPPPPLFHYPLTSSLPLLLPTLGSLFIFRGSRESALGACPPLGAGHALGGGCRRHRAGHGTWGLGVNGRILQGAIAVALQVHDSNTTATPSPSPPSLTLLVALHVQRPPRGLHPRIAGVRPQIPRKQNAAGGTGSAGSSAATPARPAEAHTAAHCLLG